MLVGTVNIIHGIPMPLLALILDLVKRYARIYSTVKSVLPKDRKRVACVARRLFERQLPGDVFAALTVRPTADSRT